MRVSRTMLTISAAAALSITPAFASTAHASSLPAGASGRTVAQAPDPGQYERANVVGTNVNIWNFWNTSNPISGDASTPSGVKLSGVAWDHSYVTYNNSYPGSLQVQICSVSPSRCFDISRYPSAWTDAFNDLDAGTTQFVFKYRWYNSTKPNGPRYDAMFGGGITPFVRASFGAWWGDSATAKVTTKNSKIPASTQLTGS